MCEPTDPRGAVKFFTDVARSRCERFCGADAQPNPSNPMLFHGRATVWRAGSPSRKSW